MYTGRIFKVKPLLKSTAKIILKISTWAAIVVCLYEYAGVKWLKIPWVPMTLVGTAVAFYLGFKNNSAYARTWEARKIWGAIVNLSRGWGILVRDFITDEFAHDSVSDQELKKIHRRLIYRHIAWLYRLKRQLRVIKEWEHDKEYNNNFRERYIKQLFPWDTPEQELQNFISIEESEKLLARKNPATQLIAHQSAELKSLKRQGLIDNFRHIEMEKMLVDFYTQQGKCERIKNFPLPRQYATVSIYFVLILILLLPLGLLSAFAGLGPHMVWGVVPFTVLIGWIFWFMELVGDFAENPFENLMFDIPMDSLTRTIEIDLREMLGETDLPEPITAKDNFVM